MGTHLLEGKGSLILERFHFRILSEQLAVEVIGCGVDIHLEITVATSKIQNCRHLLVHGNEQEQLQAKKQTLSASDLRYDL